MEHILVLGAGHSTPFLIRHLLAAAGELDWHVTVADLDRDLAERRVNGHPRGSVLGLDANDTSRRAKAIGEADLVVNMLAPSFQMLVARDCVAHGTHMVSASYESAEIHSLDAAARERGVVLLNEMGLDPGIDHMSAMALLSSVRERGGIVTDFHSYGGGLPAPESATNPLRYVITWNPRNVVMAGHAGAQYRRDGVLERISHAQVFDRIWSVDVPGAGTFEAYPNRDSLGYVDAFGLAGVRTMVRGTLRYPGFCNTWRQIVRLGLPNEERRIPDLSSRTYADVVEMFLPPMTSGSSTEERVARHLGLELRGSEMNALRWLGLFSTEPIAARGDTAAAMLIELLGRRLPLEPDGRDMVILQHELRVCFPGENDRVESIGATMVHHGDRGGTTAMARTVGLPAAVGVRMILTGELELPGSQIPARREIYEPVLKELSAAGVSFTERVVD